MKEIVSISLGPESNFAQAHFWNLQDEWLKQDPERNPVLYYETSSTLQYVPRAIFTDFRPNYGNYLSVFSHEAPVKEEAKDLWQGKLQVTEQDLISKSLYQQELDSYD